MRGGGEWYGYECECECGEDHTRDVVLCHGMVRVI